MAFIKFTTDTGGEVRVESAAASPLALVGSASVGPSLFPNLRRALAVSEASSSTCAHYSRPMGHRLIDRDNNLKNNEHLLERTENRSIPSNQALGVPDGDYN